MNKIISILSRNAQIPAQHISQDKVHVEHQEHYHSKAHLRRLVSMKKEEKPGSKQTVCGVAALEYKKEQLRPDRRIRHGE